MGKLKKAERKAEIFKSYGNTIAKLLAGIAAIILAIAKLLDKI